MAIIRNSSSCSSHILLILLILFIHLHTHSAKHPKQNLNATRCIQSELNALMEFKGSLIDESNLLSSWRGRECCSWYGITCNNVTGFVQSLDLSQSFGQPLSTFSSLPFFSPSSSLGGEINSSLLNLEHLEYLDLSNNHFNPLPIPAFLGSLKNLQFLNLYSAGFKGEIPQQLGNLSNLQRLFLGDFDDYLNVGLFPVSSSSSYPLSSKSFDWITGLSSLKVFEFYGINMNESVDWLDSVNMLSSLSSLLVSYCWLPGMSMSSNSHFNLTSLTTLDVYLNHLNVVTFPPWLFNLSHIERLDFLKNDFQGSVPNMFAEMTTLTDLYMSGNSFTSSFPDSVCNLTALNVLDLGLSDLHGSLPVCLGNLTSLTVLDVCYNKLFGTVPSTLGKLTKLQYLSVHDNSLTGELSESFFKGLKSLKYLLIHHNQFLVLNVSSQWIPPFQLRSININFVTQFPSWLQTQTNLEVLFLSSVCISGDIPNRCQSVYPRLNYFDVINSSKYLEALGLSGNNISGNIPKELCDLKFLTFLSLANNQLTGRIPSCIGNLLHLEVLELANNSLSDHIPKELGYLNKLLVLHLNMNKFFGELPSSLQNLTRLITLDVGENEMNGFIPAWVGKNFSTMQYLRLQSNDFSGQITVNLCQLSSLQILNLAQNNLVGTIPPCLGNLSMMLSEEIGQMMYSDKYSYFDNLLNVIKGRKLEYSKNLKYAKFISLSSNHLHGEIPDELMNLKGLQSLDLSNNYLSGMIPRKIGNLKDLESLDLSKNRICGTIPQSLATIDTLSYLNLSFNNLTGRIPSGNHFDTLCDPSVYEGNDRVCGKQRSCPGDLVTSNKHNGPVYGGDNNEFELSWFYVGIGTGFAIGFLAVMCPLYFNKSWRSAYFDFLENVYNRVWVAFAIKISQI